MEKKKIYELRMVLFDISQLMNMSYKQEEILEGMTYEQKSKITITNETCLDIKKNIENTIKKIKFYISESIFPKDIDIKQLELYKQSILHNIKQAEYVSALTDIELMSRTFKGYFES